MNATTSGVFTTNVDMCVTSVVDAHPPGYLSPHWHVLIIAGFIISTLVTNGVTIYVHMTNPAKYKTKVYAVALACADIFACVIGLPFFPFINKNRTFTEDDALMIKSYFSAINAATSSYLSLLVVTAFDRMLAVCFPFTYTRNYTTRSIILLTAVGVFTAYSSIISFVYRDHNYVAPIDAVLLMQIFILWLIIIVLYTIIISVLYRRGRQISTATKHSSAETEACTPSNLKTISG